MRDVSCLFNKRDDETEKTGTDELEVNETEIDNNSEIED